jgi:localization factor PodJL
MAGSVPWSVNAVDPEAWADARDAARRSGQSVGEWLEAAIRNAANDRLPPRTSANNHDHATIERRLDDIAERIEHYSRQSREPAAPARPTRHDTALLSSIEALNGRIDSLSREVRDGERNGPAEVRAALQRLDDRIEHMMSRGRVAEAGVAPELERKLEGISRSIEAMSRHLAQENARFESERRDAMPVPSTVDELDAAVAEIMMRQSVLDGTPPRGLPRRERVSREAAPSADFSGLERQLKQMADEMQALRQTGLRDEAFSTLRKEIADLSAKFAELAPRRSLEAIERAVDSIALRVDRAGSARQDETLTEVVDALHDIRTALADVRPAESFVSVEKDLHALSNKLDSLGTRGLDSGAVALLHEQTAEIRELLSGALPSDVLKALVEQIEMLVAKFEERPREQDNAILEVMSAFDRRIESLSERLDSANRAAPQVPALDDIRKRLDDLQNAVARTDRAPDDRLESSLRALAQKVDATEARLGSLGSIERGLSDLFTQLEEARGSARDAAERAAKTAVRDFASTQPVSAHEPARPATEARFTTPAEPRHEPAVTRASNDVRTVTVHGTSVAEDLADGIAPDTPIEPGSGNPRLRLQSAALRVAQSEAALGGIAPVETPGRTSDYIAAARRAAQAANAEPAAETAKSGAVSSIQSRIVSIFSNSRRALLIALTLCLLAFVAFRFLDLNVPNPFSSGGASTTAPVIPAPKRSAVEQKAPVVAEKLAAAIATKQSEAKVALPAGDPVAAPPAGVLVTPRDLHFSGQPVAAPETTGSTSTKKPATTGSITTAATPIETKVDEAKPATAADGLPAELGPDALRAAAIAGDPGAAYEIGSRYLDGRGVRADATAASVWLERAFAKGSIPAAYRLGSIHEKGLNGRKNPAEALRLYRVAAEGGNIKAMHNLAVIHAEAPEGQADIKTAVRWFRTAAERGVRDSQYNLGVLYARGLGVEQNFAESYRWFAIAANQGDVDASKKRDDVAKRLDVQTLVAAKLAVQTWAPAKIESAANEVALKPEWEQTGSPVRKRSVKK